MTAEGGRASVWLDFIREWWITSSRTSTVVLSVADVCELWLYDVLCETFCVGYRVRVIEFSECMDDVLLFWSSVSLDVSTSSLVMYSLAVNCCVLADIFVWSHEHRCCVRIIRDHRRHCVIITPCLYTAQLQKLWPDLDQIFRVDTLYLRKKNDWILNTCPWRGPRGRRLVFLPSMYAHTIWRRTTKFGTIIRLFSALTLLFGWQEGHPPAEPSIRLQDPAVPNTRDLA